MNREIKFRIWNEYDKKMIHWNKLLEQNLANIFTIPSYDKWLMQYTGLHDKNGKEIYEGDVVKFRFKKDRTECEDLIGFMEYQTQYCAFKIVSSPINGAFRIDDEVIIEVIGNIYDNPELLGGE